MDIAHLPITGVCIVSDPSKTPPNYIVIDKTFDKSEDADLWKDGIFGRRTMRYLCVERCVPEGRKDVLIDVCLIYERDLVPAGFSVVDVTQDTKEKALKKKVLCVRWMLPDLTNDAITELIFLSKATRKPPPGYTLVGETSNSLLLCYKMGKVVKPAPVAEQTTTQGYRATSYNMNPPGSSLPYSQSAYRPGTAGTLTRTGPPEQSSNSLATTTISSIAGIPWQLNPKFQVLSDLKNLSVPDVKYKTIMDIENEYQYNFNNEQSAARVDPTMR